MTSQRIQRQIDRLLDEPDEAVKRLDWPLVRGRARAALMMDPGNADAEAYLGVAERGLAGGGPARPQPDQRVSSETAPAAPGPAQPSSFANGRYQVKRFLGEGGKKRVYLAHDTRLDRDVAFALIKTEGLDQEGLDRITREAQAMGKLGDHPHIVAVFDIGEEPGGQPYIVTQYMPGGDVEGLLDKAGGHRLPIDDAVRLAQQVCQALEHAHAHGIFHRDLKPGNVWLTGPGAVSSFEFRVPSFASPDSKPETRNSQLVAKLGDFGLAVAIDRSRLTQAGMMVGTVSYMPPEQAMGGEVTARSDLYSLGAMLYEMVCGRPPFVGEESVAIITQHLNVPPVAPCWHRPDCPPGLEALILRLLEKDAAKRPASAGEVRLALEAVSSTEFRVSSGASDPKLETLNSEPRDNPLYRRTFVGREQELRQLQAAFDAALSGQGGLVMVVGEPGIGKTALCEQLATYAAVRGGRTLVGHCYEEGSHSLPYLAFVEAMRSYVLAREPEALRGELGAGAAEVARIVSEIRDKLPVEPRPPGDPEDDRWRLLQGVTTFLRNASGVQPLLLVLEDLHWADRGTLDLLLHVARNLQGARLLLIGTYRDMEVDRTHPLSSALAELRRGAAFGRVLLRGLTPDEVHRMVNSIAGQDTPWGLAEAVHRQTEGNPLFVQEVLRYLVEEGRIGRNEARGTRYEENLGIPEGLRDVIGKRLSRLSAECNRLLAIAAVIGRDFRLDTLQAVAASSSVILREQGSGGGEAGAPKNLEGGLEEAVLAALEEAERVGVVETQSRPGTVQFRFAHAFFRQTLYEELFAPRRARLHQQVGEALERLCAGRLEEHAAELAEHFAQAIERECLGKAVSYGQLAARRAMAVYAYGEAVRHLESALQAQEILGPQDKATRCDLLLDLADALMPAGEPLRAVEEAAEGAFQFAEALGDRARAARSCLLALQGLVNYGGPRMGATPLQQKWAQRADRYAEPGTVDRVWADVGMAYVVQNAGDAQTAAALKLRALALARELNDPDALFWSGLSVMNDVPQPLEERLRLVQELVERPRERVSPRMLGRVLMFSGAHFLSVGLRVRAEELWGQLDALAARSRDALVLLMPPRNEASVAILDGRLEEAVAASERLAAQGDELGSPVLARQWAASLFAYPLIRLGRAAELPPRMEEGDRMAGLEETRYGLRVHLALALAHQGRRAEAHEMLQDLLAHHEAGLAIAAGAGGTLDASVALLETAVVLEDGQAARLLMPWCAEHAGLSCTRLSLACPARVLGAAATLLGGTEQARAYYQQALEVCGKIRFRPEIALTRLGLAELLLEHYPSERAEALEHLDFAIAEFREMKMQPSLERALKHKGLLTA